jgi:adenylate cyclase
VLAIAILFPLAIGVLFHQFRIWVDVVTPETAVVLVFAAVMSLRFGTEERQRRRTSKIFGQYVKPEIVDMLVNAPDEEAALAGARRPITVLFVDIRGFTAMSERMEPEQVVSALDVYLEELTESVQEFDGTVDKYVGDELMAIWNAPTYQENHPLLAVMCALDMVARMESINEQLRARSLPAIRYGIGVNSGEAVVGQMGSTLRKQYTVIGDTVNTGARLCGAAGGAEIIIGENTWEMIGNWLVVEETDPLPLKGKRQPLRTFRVIGVRAQQRAGAHPVPAAATP